tara:strand:- start:413 stop:655 length:243 start_codon:yes stop_codon:yes gene_type:complete
MTKWVVATDVAPETDGVIGLNGIWYAEDGNGKKLEFETKQDGITFLSENGVDLDEDGNGDENIWVEPLDYEQIYKQHNRK